MVQIGQSNFLNFFNQLAAKKLNDQQIYNPLIVVKEHPTINIRTIQKLPMRKEITKDRLEYHINGIQSLPSELQTLILEEVDSPSTYVDIRTICSQKAINDYAIKTLKEIGKYEQADRLLMRLSSSTPEKYLLQHVFQIVRSKCSKDELEAIVAHYSQETQTIEQKARSFTEKSSEKILHVVSKILNLTIVRVVLGIVVCIFALKQSFRILIYTQNTLIPLISHKIMAYAPLPFVQLGTILGTAYAKLYKERGWVFIVLLGVSYKYGVQSILYRTLNVVWKLLLIPGQILNLPFNLAWYFGSSTYYRSKEVAVLSGRGNHLLNVYRMQKGLNAAQEGWVQQMMSQDLQTV